MRIVDLCDSVSPRQELDDLAQSERIPSSKEVLEILRRGISDDAHADTINVWTQDRERFEEQFRTLLRAHPSEE